MLLHTIMKQKGCNVQADVSSSCSVKGGLVLGYVSGFLGDTALDDRTSPSNIAGIAVLELWLKKVPHWRGRAFRIAGQNTTFGVSKNHALIKIQLYASTISCPNDRNMSHTTPPSLSSQVLCFPSKIETFRPFILCICDVCESLPEFQSICTRIG